MIIDLQRQRQDYFADSTAAEILRRVLAKEADAPITVADVRKLSPEFCIVGTAEVRLEDLLRGEGYNVDSLGLVQQIENASSSQIIFLPSEYRIPAAEAHHTVAHSYKTLVNLDSAAVKQALLDTAPTGRLSAKAKEAAQWHPEKVLAAAFNHLHFQRERLAEETFSCYAWKGRDNHRRVVSLYRAIQGAELRAFQNYAGYRLFIPTHRKELKTGLRARDRSKLSPGELAKRRDDLARYQKYVVSRGLTEHLRRLEVTFTDLIEMQGAPFAFETAAPMRVPSRSHPPQVYEFDLTSLPLVTPDDPVAYSAVWEMRGNDHCYDKRFRSNRRKQERFRGQDEDFFCPHEIAAAHTVRKIYEKRERQIPFLPFVIPTPEMMAYTEKLRHQTLLVMRNPETKRTSKRALNHTEIENLLWKRVLAYGYQANFTTNIDALREARVDPHTYLIKFKG